MSIFKNLFRKKNSLMDSCHVNGSIVHKWKNWDERICTICGEDLSNISLSSVSAAKYLVIKKNYTIFHDKFFIQKGYLKIAWNPYWGARNNDYSYKLVTNNTLVIVIRGWDENPTRIIIQIKELGPDKTMLELILDCEYRVMEKPGYKAYEQWSVGMLKDIALFS